MIALGVWTVPSTILIIAAITVGTVMGLTVVYADQIFKKRSIWFCNHCRFWISVGWDPPFIYIHREHCKEHWKP